MTFYNIIFGILFLAACREMYQDYHDKRWISRTEYDPADYALKEEQTQEGGHYGYNQLGKRAYRRGYGPR